MFYNDMERDIGWSDAGVVFDRSRVIWRSGADEDGSSVSISQTVDDPDTLRISFDRRDKDLSRGDAERLHDAIGSKLSAEDGPFIADIPFIADLVGDRTMSRGDAEGLRDVIGIWLEHGEETVPHDVPWGITIMGEGGTDLEPEEEREYWRGYLKDHRSPYLDEDLDPIGVDKTDSQALNGCREGLDDVYRIVHALRLAGRLCDAGRVIVRFDKYRYFSYSSRVYVVWDRDADYRDMARFQDVSEALGYRGGMVSARRMLGIPVEGRCEVITAYVRPGEDDEHEWWRCHERRWPWVRYGNHEPRRSGHGRSEGQRIRPRGHRQVHHETAGQVGVLEGAVPEVLGAHPWNA